MTWYCQVCAVQNPDHTEFCRQCSQHWRQTWKPPKRKQRSKSRNKGPKEKEKGPRPKENEEEDLQIFPGKVPWIASTPQSRLPKGNKLEAANSGHTEGVENQEMQAPVPPTSSGEALKEEETKLLEHLRALAKMDLELSEGQQQKLKELEEREQTDATSKGLSHGHINRLHKYQDRVKAQAKKIRELDSEWVKLLEQVNSKIQRHALLYQQTRADYLEEYNTRCQQLANVRKEVSSASQTLLNLGAGDETVEDMPDVHQNIESLQQALLAAGQAHMISDEEEETDLNMEDGQPGKTKKFPSMMPFRAAGSPQRVATSHLKPKPEKKDK